MWGVALGLFIGMPVSAGIQARAAVVPTGVAMLLMSSAPVVAVGWTVLNEGRAHPRGLDRWSWRVQALDTLLVVGLLVIWGVLRRHRGRRGFGGLLALGVVSGFALFVAAAIGGMSLTRTWL